jgi:hypothetical protein
MRRNLRRGGCRASGGLPVTGQLGHVAPTGRAGYVYPARVPVTRDLHADKRPEGILFNAAMPVTYDGFIYFP